MRRAVEKALGFKTGDLLVLSCLITLVRLLGLSFSTYDKGASFPLLMVLSACHAWLGGSATLISFLVVLGAVLRRWVSRK
jgi:hypothetical protein